MACPKCSDHDQALISSILRRSMARVRALRGENLDFSSLAALILETAFLCVRREKSFLYNPRSSYLQKVDHMKTLCLSKCF